MLPKNLSRLKIYIYAFVFIEQKILRILKNRNSKKTVGVGEKQKVDLVSAGSLQLKSTHAIKKVSNKKIILLYLLNKKS